MIRLGYGDFLHYASNGFPLLLGGAEISEFMITCRDMNEERYEGNIRILGGRNPGFFDWEAIPCDGARGRYEVDGMIYGIEIVRNNSPERLLSRFGAERENEKRITNYIAGEVVRFDSEFQDDGENIFKGR